MDAPVRFIIVTIGRTGSTRIRKLLDSHPDVRCHGEVFGESIGQLAQGDAAPLERLVAERAADPGEFLVRRALSAPEVRAVGVKILCNQLFDRHPGLLARLRVERDVRIIHLVRRDGIRRFVSEWCVGAGLVRHSYSVHESAPEVRPIVIPIEAVRADLARVEAERARVVREFSGHPFMELGYEDSLEDNGAAMRRVQEFVGVVPATLSCDLRRVLPEDPRALVANYDEIVAALDPSTSQGRS